MHVIFPAVDRGGSEYVVSSVCAQFASTFALKIRVGLVR